MGVFYLKTEQMKEDVKSSPERRELICNRILTLSSSKLSVLRFSDKAMFRMKIQKNALAGEKRTEQ